MAGRGKGWFSLLRFSRAPTRLPKMSVCVQFSINLLFFKSVLLNPFQSFFKFLTMLKFMGCPHVHKWGLFRILSNVCKLNDPRKMPYNKKYKMERTSKKGHKFHIIYRRPIISSCQSSRGEFQFVLGVILRVTFHWPLISHYISSFS